MKVISKQATKKYQNSNHCVAFEYPFNDKDINGAVIEISGRYPETGRTVNEVCKEMAYVTKGQGKVVIENQEFRLAENDVVLIQPKERYYWAGDFTMFVPCSPAWYPEQHKEVD